MDLDASLRSIHIAVVIPAYRAADSLPAVVAGIPDWVRSIVVVDDASGDDTADVADRLAGADERVFVVRRPANGGVGAAMKSGYLRAVESGAHIVVKMDSDGQMDPDYLAHLVLPLALGEADYAKGNRFLRPDTLTRMPLARLLGNAVLSFASKLSSGYWSVFDPTNGFTAVSREALTTIDVSRVEDGYFFESSMLAELGLARAVVVDVAMPSRYGDEKSHLSIVSALLTFGPKHLRRFGRRVFHRYILTDFSAASLLLFVGAPLVLYGVWFGATAWIEGAELDRPATAGTVMIAAFTTAGGLYCLVQAMVYDMLNMPQRPLTFPRLGLLTSAELIANRTR
ncbi:MAG: dolichol-phosphate mannosyltransferase [Hyphomicrobiaceae bacterium]